MLNNPDNLENMVDDDVTVTNDEASFANLAGESLTSLVEIVPFTRDQVRKFIADRLILEPKFEQDTYLYCNSLSKKLATFGPFWPLLASFANLAGKSLSSLVKIFPFTRDWVRKSGILPLWPFLTIFD